MLKDEESELLCRVKRGDAIAFEPLVDPYTTLLFRYILYLVKNPDDAADLVQETLLAAYEGITEFRGGASFKTWLFRIAGNQAFTFLRNKRRKMAYLPTDDLDRQTAELASEVETNDSLTFIFDTVLSGDDLSRSVMTMKKCEGYSYRQISERLNIPEGTVKSLFWRACQKVRIYVETHYRGDVSALLGGGEPAEEVSASWGEADICWNFVEEHIAELEAEQSLCMQQSGCGSRLDAIDRLLDRLLSLRACFAQQLLDRLLFFDKE